MGRQDHQTLVKERKDRQSPGLQCISKEDLALRQRHLPGESCTLHECAALVLLLFSAFG